MATIGREGGENIYKRKDEDLDLVVGPGRLDPEVVTIELIKALKEQRVNLSWDEIDEVVASILRIQGRRGSRMQVGPLPGDSYREIVGSFDKSTQEELLALSKRTKGVIQFKSGEAAFSIGDKTFWSA